MNIGIMGCGKLGFPVALAIESRGHSVKGFDLKPEMAKYIKNKYYPFQEHGVNIFLANSKFEMVSLPELVAFSDIIFVAVETPHEPEFEGATAVSYERKDFDYTVLKAALNSLFIEIRDKDVHGLGKQYKSYSHTGLMRKGVGEKKIIVSIISTVLPGTIRREIFPLLNDRVDLVYNPFFIAMGTTIYDFLNPEFILCGTESDTAALELERFYATINDKPLKRMSIESAELCKVFYNTLITQKITAANVLMEICEKIPQADCDQITHCLKIATDRIVSPKYMDGGMQDGGACHPRDLIAMSWLARELDLSYNIYDDLVYGREAQTEWLVDLTIKYITEYPRKEFVILGKTFKKGSSLTDGSAARLFVNILKEKNLDGMITHWYDPYIDTKPLKVEKPAIFFIATNHDEFKDFPFPDGSIVIDPWRYIPCKDRLKVIGVGEGL